MRRVLALAALGAALCAASASAATDPTDPPPYRIRACQPGGACDVVCESTDVCVREHPDDPLPSWCVHWDVYDPDHDILCAGGNDIPPDVRAVLIREIILR